MSNICTLEFANEIALLITRSWAPLLLLQALTVAAFATLFLCGIKLGGSSGEAGNYV